MPTYLHPGVYIEEIPSGSKPIEGVGTSTAAFVGYTTKGPIGEPELVLKWDDYDRRYGGIRDTKTAEGDPMGFSVAAFFQNGGGKAYVVRITRDWNKDDADPLAFDARKAVGYLDDPSRTGDHGLRFSAIDEGAWANGLIVRMAVSAVVPGLYDIEIGRKNEDGELEAQERYINVSMAPEDPLFITNVINDASGLVRVEQVPVADKTITSRAYEGKTVSGSLAGASLDFSSGFTDPLSRTLEITLDSETAFSKVLPDRDFAGSLTDLAAEIERLVRTGASVPRRTGFTCTVEEDKLVLISGTREAASMVTVAAPSGAPGTHVVKTLKLTPADGAKQFTGQESADAAWSRSQPEDTLSGGEDGNKPLTDDYIDVFTKFVKYRDISIICLPGQSWAKDGSGNPVIDAAIGHAIKMKSRMVIVDPPVTTELETPKDVNDLNLPSKTYSVMYYPWVKMANPFYNAETNPGAAKTVLVPPSGFAAGIWAKIDGTRGVWKAPAGLESALLGVAGLQYVVEDGEQDALNPLGVNCLRKMPGAGHVIWGARTLATRADPEWRYVPVRRTAIMIEQSIYNGIQWAVFEPNDHRLWASLRANIGGFMNSLFRVGAFQGEKATDAYFVRCGLGATMTQTDIDAGQVIVVVGFAPLKPAEFVIVRIQQKVNQQ